MDFLKFCCSFCDLDFVHSNFKVMQYPRLTIAFMLVLSQSSQILLPLCNPAIPSLAVSCFISILMMTQLHPKDPENRQQNRFSERRGLSANNAQFVSVDLIGEKNQVILE